MSSNNVENSEVTIQHTIDGVGEAMQPAGINASVADNIHDNSQIQAFGPAIEPERADQLQAAMQQTNDGVGGAMQPVLNNISVPVNMHANEQGLAFGNPEAVQPALINGNEPLHMHANGQLQAFVANSGAQNADHTKISELPALINDGAPVWHRNEPSLEHCDEESIKGHFGWEQFDDVLLPYIYRHSEKYCAVRMFHLKLLMKYLNFLHPETYAFIPCASSYPMSASEARLFSEIHKNHDDAELGSYIFTQRDWVVRLNDAFQFYQYLDVCYRKLVKVNKAPAEKCGFLRINNRTVVPFTICNNQKMLPIFYFQHETKLLTRKAQMLTGWDLAYLKFCIKVQGTGDDLLRADNVAVVSLCGIKSIYPSGTVFKNYWPKKIDSAKLLMAKLTYPYKVKMVNVNNKLVWCINKQAFINTTQLMTLTEFQKNFHPNMPLSDCKRQIESLGVLMYKAKRYQAEVLKEYDIAYTESTPLVQVKDIVKHMAQLNFLLQH